MNQIEYKPWAANNVKEIINKSSQELPILRYTTRWSL